jgi:hypothetical protein
MSLMRFSHFKKSFLIGILLLGAGSGTFYFLSARHNPKEDLLKYGFSPIRHTKKMESPIQIRIERISEEKPEPNVAIRLRATVFSRMEFPQVSWKWILPADAKVVSGFVASNAPILPSREEQSFEIEFVPTTTENQSATFQIESFDGKFKVGNSAQYNIYWQDMLVSRRAAYANDQLKKQK